MKSCPKLRLQTIHFLLLPTMIIAGLLVSVPRAHAAAKYWIGTGTGAATAAQVDRWELDRNWSLTRRGHQDTVAPTSADVAILDLSGTTVRIRSKVNVQGLVLTSSWTGSLLQGTGTLRIGSAGMKVGSGTFVGGYGTASTASGMLNISGTSGFTQTGGIVKNIIKNFNNSGSLSIMSVSGNRPSFTLTGALIFSGNATQTFTIGKHRVTAIIKDLTLNNSGSAGSNRLYSSGSGVSLSGALTVTQGILDLTKSSTAQPLIVEGGTTVTTTLLSGNNITISGSLTVGSSATMTVTGGTLTFNSDNPQTVTISNSNQQFNNVTINNTAATTARNKVTFATNPFTVLGNVAVTQGSWDATTNSIATGVVGSVTVADSALAQFLTAGNLTLSGSVTVKPAATFTQSAGTTNLNGTSQTLSGSMTINNLQKTMTSADTLSFYPGSTYTIASIESMYGASSTAKLTVQSSISGQRWTIAPGTKKTVQFLALKDSYNLYATSKSLTCLDCTDNGNNEGWGFATSPTVNTTASSTGGGGGGGGGGRRGSPSPTSSSPATTTVTVPSPAISAPEADTMTKMVSNHAKTLQKRVDTVQARINATKNESLKKSLERGLDRLKKMMSKLK